MKTLSSILLLLVLTTLSSKAQMIEIPDNWGIFEGEYSGKPLIVRANTGLKNFPDQKTFPAKLGIAIPLSEQDKQGLPTQKEQEMLYSIEDSLEILINVENHTILALIITTNGMREFVLYSQSNNKAEKIASKLHSIVKSHEVQFYIEEDSSWSTFNEFVQ